MSACVCARACGGGGGGGGGAGAHILQVGLDFHVLQALLEVREQRARRHLRLNRRRVRRERLVPENVRGVYEACGGGDGAAARANPSRIRTPRARARAHGQARAKPSARAPHHLPRAARRARRTRLLQVSKDEAIHVVRGDRHAARHAPPPAGAPHRSPDHTLPAARVPARRPPVRRAAGTPLTLHAARLHRAGGAGGRGRALRDALPSEGCGPPPAPRHPRKCVSATHGARDGLCAILLTAARGACA